MIWQSKAEKERASAVEQSLCDHPEYKGGECVICGKTVISGGTAFGAGASTAGGTAFGAGAFAAPAALAIGAEAMASAEGSVAINAHATVKDEFFLRSKLPWRRRAWRLLVLPIRYLLWGHIRL